jgi:hypothetical protein
MDEDELSSLWREASRRYVSAINAHVERGLREGWERAGPKPQDDREHLAADVLAAVRRANASGDTASLREKFPPAWEPFLPILPEKGQWLKPMAWIDDDRIAVGLWSGPGSIVVVSSDGIAVQQGVRGFGRSPDRRFFALAFDDGVEVRQGWDGPRVAWLNWPRGPKGLFGEGTIRELIVFPDGKRVLLVSPLGIFVLAEGGNTQLPLTKCREELDRSRAEKPDEPSDHEMAHGAISPRGDSVLVGCQDTKHLVFNARLELIAQVGPRSDSPTFAWFSADGSVAAFNACNFYDGVSIGVSVADLPGLDTPSFREHPKVHVLDDHARVYDAVGRSDEFIVGDAQGYLRAFDLQGNFRWQHFIGSTIGALDLSPDKQRLAVTSYPGFLCVLQLDAAERDPFAIGTASHRELQRWLFWKGEDRVLKW